MQEGKTRWGRLIGMVVLVLLVDQLSKRLVVTSMVLGESITPVPALSDVFRITYSYNTGSAFGFMPQAGDVFLVLALLIVAGLFWYYPRIPNHAPVTQIAIGMICGGALGNALDRLEYGHVVDFIHYRIPDLISNISNLADHAIVLGVILIFIDSFRLERLEKRQAEANAQEAVPDGSGGGIEADDSSTESYR